MRTTLDHLRERNQMKAAATDKIFFEQADIKVTETRFQTSTESFQIKRISAVRIASEKRKTRIGIPLAMIGGTALIGGALSNLPVLIIAGAAFAVGGTMMCLTRVTSSVVLTVRGQDVNAITSKDRALVQTIADAVRDAIARRQ